MVEEFKFLGNTITKNGNLTQSAKYLANKSLKVMYSIKAHTSYLNQLPANLACHLFDSLVKPILTYNGEIWYMDIYKSYYNSSKRAENNNLKSDYLGFIDKSIVDKVHTKFCKFTLGVKKCASNIASRAELGRYPIDNFIKVQSLLYEDRLLNDTKINPILQECYKVSKFIDSKGIYSWYTYVNHIRKQLDLQTDENININKKLKAEYKIRIHNFYREYFSDKIQNLESNSKL